MGEPAIELASLPPAAGSNGGGNADKRLSAVSATNTFTSGNSLLTGTSQTTAARSARRAARNRRANASKTAALKSAAVALNEFGSRKVRALKRPFVRVNEWWQRRRRLPPSPDGRKVRFDAEKEVSNLDTRTNKPFCSNVITSSIYTVQDFVPRQLMAQFSKLANVYFLCVAILQMIPGWSATGNYTTIVPLCVFVMISMGREGYEDFVRHRNDAEENNREVLVRKGENQYDTVKWKDLKVGDVVRVLQNEWVPADIVLLHSSGPKGQCSIETLALDGESNLKSKDVPAEVQEYFGADWHGGAEVTCEDPNMDLFNFEGTIALGDSSRLIPLNNNNIIYRGCTLRSTASVSGVIVYSGKETKMQLNASKGSRIKAPKLQSKVNKVVMALAGVVVVLSGALTGAAGHMQRTHSYWYFDGIQVTTTQVMMGFIIMLNTLIPISLYVSMEICKVLQTLLMQSDVDMYDSVNDVCCTVQSSSLNEELGQVSYVFSDKTGTLTDNIMLFRKLSVGGHAWTHDLDLYLGEESDGYLFRQVRPNTDMEVELLEQLSKLPRKSFGGRVGPRLSMGRLSMSRPSMSRLSTSRPSTSRASNLRPSTSRPSTSRPSTSRASTSRALGTTTVQKPSPLGQNPLGHQPGSGQSEGEEPEEKIDEKKVEHTVTEEPARPSGSLFNESAALGWESSAQPGKQSTPSTLTLLEYMQQNPNSPYTARAKFFLLALALCHSASPVVDLAQGVDGDEIEQLDYQASSPDELALVSAARDLGYLVIDRQTDSCTVRTYPNGLDKPPVDEKYKILDSIEFTSARKRMSVIVQLPNGRIVLLCKGADNVMIERLQKQLIGTAHQKQEALQTEGAARRSMEQRIAKDSRKFEQEVRPSLDMILSRSSVDQEIQETARRSMSLQRRSMDLRTNIQSNVRNSIQSALADARSAAEENAMETRMSLERSNSLRSKRSMDLKMMAPPPTIPAAQQAQLPKHNNNSNSSVGSNGGSSGNGSSGSKQQQQHQQQQQSELMDERQALERTLEHIDEFSTEGLRTLLYGHRFLTPEEYARWKSDYDEARAAISNRQQKVDEVGERIEWEFEVTGASAIEDKLQKGVPEAIDKLRRANIHLWMLTGDKRETAVNIGYSCRLIKDYSTVISLKVEEDSLEEKLMAALEELDDGHIVHCVVVIDGQTLAFVEKDPILLSLFVDLGLKADSVILCRASPAQKANIVKCVRKREPEKVMLAIGDGANDIAMIQAADVGVGIAGREGLQAARSSDFSIGQFRFLLKLLLVHGRWNYNRTCKYILATFYKEFMFYMSQVVYQRYTLFTGTSVFESWSIAMFNTLFTSLPVISLGVMDQDLSPTTLLAVPELYNIGQKNRQFHFGVLLMWLVVGTLECLMIGFVTYVIYGSQMQLKDNTIFPFGVIVFTVVVAVVNIKTQFIVMMYYITIISVLVVVISVGGYWLFNIFIGGIYILDPSKTYYAEREFWNQTGTEVFYWAICLFAAMTAILFELLIKMVTFIFFPTDVDEFQRLEKDPFIMRRLEAEAEIELSSGWEYQDNMPHSWWALLRGQLPGQARNTKEIRTKTLKRRRKDIIKETLHIRKPDDDDREIQEILERRQRETAQP